MDLTIPNYLTMGRYKRRMRDVLELHKNGEYFSVTEQSATMAKGLAEIFDFNGHKNPYFSVAKFGDLGLKIINEFNSRDDSLVFGHSAYAFSRIGEYTPSTSFVFATPPFPTSEIICGKN